MNLQTLRYVVTIAQTGSLSKASQYLFVSQSTLSRSVKELEQQLGISLFFRTNQGVQVTHDGEEFISRANQILMDISVLEVSIFTAVVRSNPRCWWRPSGAMR